MGIRCETLSGAAIIEHLEKTARPLINDQAGQQLTFLNVRFFRICSGK